MGRGRSGGRSAGRSGGGGRSHGHFGGRSHGARHGHFGGGFGHGGIGHHHHHHHHFGGGHRFGASHHRHSAPRQLIPPPPMPTAVFALETEGTDPACGFPGCCMDSVISVKATDARSVPAGLADVYTETEWMQLVFKINQVHTETSWPPCPSFFLFFCVYLCCLVSCQSRRQETLQAIAAQENARLAGQGLEWLVVNTAWEWHPMVRGVCLVLSWTPQRKEWELANPARRKISLEYPPQRFCSYDQLAAQGLLTPEQIQMHQAMLQQQAAAGGGPLQIQVGAPVVQFGAPPVVYQPMPGQPMGPQLGQPLPPGGVAAYPPGGMAAYPPPPYPPAAYPPPAPGHQTMEAPIPPAQPGQVQPALPMYAAQPTMVQMTPHGSAASPPYVPPPQQYGQPVYSPSAPSNPAGAGFCGACGAARLPADRFCAGCGHPL